jgi:alkylated DNA repair dioxygenase AlkB
VELIPISGAELYYDPHFLSPEEASRLLNLLKEKCAWERRQAAFGHAVPRDEAYYGDPGAHYTYSRREYKPLAWIPESLTLKARVEAATPEAAYSKLSLQRCPYNAVLCNLYRDGNDSVGLHADNEPEMGPVIASVSLGAERLFRLRRKGGAIAFSERLCSGTLLIMAGHTQETSNTTFRRRRPSRSHISILHSGE